MLSRLSTESLARTAARHPSRTVAVWIVLILAAGYFAGGLGDVTSDENTTNTEFTQAEDLIAERFRTSTGPVQEFVIVEAESADAASEIDGAVAALASDLRALEETGHVQTHLDGRSDLLTADGRIALI